MLSKATQEYIQRVVDTAPPLTPEQRDKLAALLSPIDKQAPARVPTKFEAEIERLADGVFDVE